MRLDLLVHASMASDDNLNPISPEALLGNIFIFMFAGHEANANTLNFIIILLACHPDIQAQLQAELDRIFGSIEPGDWTMEAFYPALSNSLVGAVISEASRLFTVLPYIPKASPTSPQSIRLADKQYIVPANMLVLVNTSAIHRHPANWPPPPLRDPEMTLTASNPVDAFNPHLWLNHDAEKQDDQRPQRLLTPKHGTYLPFSEGARVCLGKRFAQVEMVASVARIFKEYSVELVTDCSDDASLPMKSQKWDEARRAAVREMSAGVEFRMSMRLVGKVPVKFVKRGDESDAGVNGD